MARVTVYSALRHRFRLQCDDDAFGRHLERDFASLASPASAGAAATTYTVDLHAGSGQHALSVDARRVVTTRSPSGPYAHLLHRVNTRAIADSRDLTRLHAAAVVHAGRAVLLPGAMESGKSTLAAALCLRGLGYVTDEVVAIDPATGVVVPYPRAISLDPGSWPLLPECAPDVPAVVRSYVPRQWQVRPAQLPGGVATEPIEVAAVVVHRYRPGASELSSLDPFEALRQLMGACFEVADHPARDLGVLARLCDTVPLARLETGDLGEAADHVLSWLGTVS